MLPVITGFFWMPYDPSEMDIGAKSVGPCLQHLFGTDYFGRDIFSRVLEGARMTFLVGAASIGIGATAGIFIGALTGYFGGPVDDILMRVNDALASFPSVLLALVLVSIFGSGKYMIILTLGIVFIPSFARVARGEFIAQKKKDYVKNAMLMGAGPLRIMFLHILPNTKAILLSAVTIGFNNAVLAEAGLSYLSIGAQPTDVSLGRMLSEAQGYLMTAPWFALAPGLTIVITVLGCSLISESLAKTGVPTAKKHKKKKQGVAAVLEGQQQEQAVEIPSEALLKKYCKTVTEPVLLEVRNLTVGFFEENAWDYVVKNASFTVRRGEVLGIVGESGSGKSMTALAVMGLLKKQGKITSGTMDFNGRELTTISAEEYQRIRGFELSMVFQEPMTSLNPLLTVGYQVEEMLRLHGLVDANSYDEGKTEDMEQKSTRHSAEFYRRCKERTLAALQEAGLKDPTIIYDKYPHELSGGMRQRVMIAMAMICNPKLLIADEPTTALDVTIQAKILKLLKQMNRKHGTSIIFISHDLNIIRKMCDRVVVMYHGEMIEQGSAEKVFAEPQHEYTVKLLHAALGEKSRKPAAEYGDACFSEDGDLRDASSASLGRQQPHMLDLQHVNVYYPEKSKKLFIPAGRKQVVEDVTLHVRSGEILGLVGESGCGKSSLAKAIVGLQSIVEGQILLGTNHPQMVFQDPYGSLNPSKKISWLLEEPLRMSCTSMTKEEREKRVDEILNKVDLPLRYRNRYPADLSGGQRQRVAIAIALILNQKLIILDEPVSALDVTVQEQILELLLRLRDTEDLSYLFISHDMKVIRHICDYVCVMYQGRIVEHARTEEIFTNPQNDYTKKLIQAAEL